MSAATFFLLSLFYELTFYYLLCVPFEEHLRSTRKLWLGVVLCLTGSCLLLTFLAPSLGITGAAIAIVVSIVII